MCEQQLSPHTPVRGQWDEVSVTRRRFLEIGVWASTGAASLTLVGAGTRFVIGDSLEPAKERWVQLADIANLPIGQVHKATYKVRQKDAWHNIEQSGILYIFSDDGLSYTALEASCTHMGCNVKWQAEDGQFHCPCHDAQFARDGAVVNGPPPRALRRLETKVENEQLSVLI